MISLLAGTHAWMESTPAAFFDHTGRVMAGVLIVAISDAPLLHATVARPTSSTTTSGGHTCDLPSWSNGSVGALTGGVSMPRAAERYASRPNV